jgi:hypothetical protein
MQTIQITGATGSGAYDVYLCDTTLNFCTLITGSTAIPPTYEFTLPTNFENVQSVVVKLIDTASGCEIIKLYNCPTSTPTPTPAPTPTPTPTSLCRCIEAINSTSSDGTFDYVDCFGNSHSIIVPNNTTVYYCGTSPTNANGVVLSIGAECLEFSCV